MFYRGCVPQMVSAEDEKPSSHLLEMLVSHNFLVMVHGFKDILCKMNILNTKLQSSGVTYNTECETGMSVEDVLAIVNIKNTEGTIDYTQVQNWVGGGCGAGPPLITMTT